jgi:hypothetical protein
MPGRGNQFFTFVYGNSEIAIFVLLAIFLIAFFLVLAASRGRKLPPLRTLIPYQRIKGAVGRAAELGKTVHFSPGSGSLSQGSHPVETLAGLTVGEAVARQAAQSSARLVTTTNGPVAYAVADNVTSRGYSAVGRFADYQPSDTRFITQSQNDSLPYLVGAADVVEHENTELNIAVGYFGPEYLLLGESAVRNGANQIVGASEASAIPMMLTTTDPEQVLIGEEIFAGGAYLQERASHIASLLAQDALRIVIIILIIVGVVLANVAPDWLNFIFSR